MEKNNWDWDTLEIDPKILSDYDSEDFDVGTIADDYDLCDVDETSETWEKDAERQEPGEEKFVFEDLNEPLQDWEFDGMQLEKHSRNSHVSKRKQKKNEREAERKEKEAEEARQEAFERVSRTVQAPIASQVVGDASVEGQQEEESGEE